MEWDKESHHGNAPVRDVRENKVGFYILICVLLPL